MIRLALLFSAALLVVTAPLVAASPAAAQSCGGGSSSSDSGGSDDDVGYDDDDYDSGFAPDYDSGGGGSSEPPAPPCVETSEVVGRAECRDFGDGWNTAGVPPLRLDLGVSTRRLSLADHVLATTSMHDGNPYRWTFSGADLRDDDVLATSFDLRLSLGVVGPLYLGAEASVGAATVSGETFMTPDGLRLEPTSVLTVGGGAVAGLRVPFGDFQLEAEVLVGGRGVFVSVDSLLGDCVVTHSADRGLFVIEPRLAVEWFVSPHFSLRAWGGTNALDWQSFAAGGQVSIHFRRWDGGAGR